MPRLYLLVLLCLTAGLFLPSVYHEFVEWDDSMNLTRNPLVFPPAPAKLLEVWTRPHEGLYVPVTYALWEAVALVATVPQDDRTVALNPYLFHLLNLILHTLNVWLVWRLLRRLTGCDAPAFLGALVFALHPVQVEAVAWVSGMKDLLFAGLSLLALERWLAFARPGKHAGGGHYVLATVAFVLAMLAKPTAVVVPVLAGLLSLWPDPNPTEQAPARRPWLALAGWFALALPVMVLTRLVQQANPALADVAGPLWARPLVALDAVAFYLYKLAFPVWLGIDYGRTPHAVIRSGWIYVSWLLPAALATGLWVARRRPLLLAGAVFLVPLLPVLGLVPFNFQLYSTVADHYLYLPMLGTALASTFLATRLPKRGWAVFGLILALWAVWTEVQITHWRDNQALFTHALVVNPGSFAGHNNLAILLDRAGQSEAAERHYRAALTTFPRFVPARSRLAQLLLQQGQVDAGLDQWLEATRLAAAQDPGSDLSPVYLQIGAMLEQRGRIGEARQLYEQASRQQPGNAEIEARRRRVTTAPSP